MSEVVVAVWVASKKEYATIPYKRVTVRKSLDEICHYVEVELTDSELKYVHKHGTLQVRFVSKYITEGKAEYLGRYGYHPVTTVYIDEVSTTYEDNNWSKPRARHNRQQMGRLDTRTADAPHGFAKSRFGCGNQRKRSYLLAVEQRRHHKHTYIVFVGKRKSVGKTYDSRRSARIYNYVQSARWTIHRKCIRQECKRMGLCNRRGSEYPKGKLHRKRRRTVPRIHYQR